MGLFKAFLQGFTTPMSRESASSLAGSDNFTDDAKQALTMSRLEAERLNHNFIGTEHLLLGIIRLGKGTAVAVMAKIGIDLDRMRAEVENFVGAGPEQKISGDIPSTPRTKKVLALARKEARELNHNSIGTEHFLLAILREGDNVAARVLQKFDLDLKVIKECVLKEIDPSYPSTAMEDEVAKRKRVMVDINKRYDLYCRDVDGDSIYRNVRFKGVKNLFTEPQFTYADFVEIEQADGTAVFIGRHSIARFCEHGVTPDVELIPRKKE
jgi:hypothetical protein